jgi:hypothetical protein
MPFGLQIVGGFRSDHQVLGAAHAMERAFASSAELRRPRPDLQLLLKTQPQPPLRSIVTAAPDAERAAGAASASDSASASVV